MSTLVCFSTCPDRESARHLADTLVAERLAACVNILPGLVSTYRWQQEIRHDEECLLIIKTTAASFARLRTRLLALHPYQLPELLALEARDGLPAYLDWVQAETGPA